MIDDLEARALAHLRRLFEPLPVSIDRDYHRYWMVILGRDDRWAGGLTLAKRQDNLHDAVRAVERLLRGIGRKRLVDQLARATGGLPIDLPDEWYARRA